MIQNQKSEPSWQDNELFLDGKRASKLRGIKYKYAQEHELIYAAGNLPISIQPGNVSVIGELKMLKGDLDDLNERARAAGFPNIVGVAMTGVNSYKATAGTKQRTVTLSSLIITDFEEGWDQAAKFMEITCPFLALDMKGV